MNFTRFKTVWNLILKEKMIHRLTVQKCFQELKNDSRIFIQGAAMTPTNLVAMLCEEYQSFSNIELIHLHTEGIAKYAESPYSNSFNINSFFVAGNVRSCINEGNGNYLPIF
tara:strand:- start:80071 stop:80406 length:336 start_codon:yes stop_codon:yes gene_type:complete